MVIGHIDTYIIAEVADFVVPAHGHLDTAVDNIAAVDCGGTCTIRSQDGRVNKPVLGSLAVPVEVEAETVAEELGVDAEVPLVRTFPCQVGICDFVGVRTDNFAPDVVAKEIIGAAYGHSCQILEVCDIAVTVLTPAGADLELIEPVGRCLHEFFLIDVPAGGERGEIAPAMTAGKV